MSQYFLQKDDDIMDPLDAISLISTADESICSFSDEPVIDPPKQEASIVTNIAPYSFCRPEPLDEGFPPNTIQTLLPITSSEEFEILEECLLTEENKNDYVSFVTVDSDEITNN